MAINFVKNDDIRILRDIEQYYSTQIDEMPMNGAPPVRRGWGSGAWLSFPFHLSGVFFACSCRSHLKSLPHRG